MRRGLAGCLIACCALAAAAQDGALRPRVERMLRAGQLDLALSTLEDHVHRGGRLEPDLRALRVRLQSEGDHFDRLANELTSGRPKDDPATQAMLFEMAREQFARGQYVGALERIRALPPDAAERLPQLPIFSAMAAQAVGELRAARQELEAISSRHPEYAMSRILLADLLLRLREAPLALEQAEAAWKADAEGVGAQALYLQGAALTQLGRHDEARKTHEELSRRFPHSAEAARAPEAPAAVSQAAGEVEIPESPSPERRVHFALQLGAFRDRSLALRLGERLRGQVEELHIEHDMSANPPWYRVVAGSFATRAAAEAELKKLRQRDIESILLAPGQSGP
jgi:tetratricopeptide (TPR) repeat protein